MPSSACKMQLNKILKQNAKREMILRLGFVFFNDTATTEIYTLSLHDALPIWSRPDQGVEVGVGLRLRVERGQPLGAGGGEEALVRGDEDEEIGRAHV